jgi:hypothetical protein
MRASIKTRIFSPGSSQKNALEFVLGYHAFMHAALVILLLAFQSPSSQVDLAQQAVAQAKAKEFDAAVASLQELAATGVALEDDLDGTGSPMKDVVNAIYEKCWANFNPEFNRKCWLSMFDAFPDSQYATVAASRLLMAGLKDDVANEITRFEKFFSKAEQTPDVKRRYVDAYLKAAISNDKVLRLAIEAWDASWSTADEKHNGNHIECELDTDKAFSALSMATVLHESGLQSNNPLFAMEAEPTVTFDDVTANIGLADLKETRVAACDFDKDGDPDLSFGGRLFENQKGVFVEVGKERGITHKGSGSAFGDYDGDGYFDLLIAASPSPFLYRNLGKKGKYRFENVTDSCGFADVNLAAGPEGISWVDVDNDGDLDIYIAVYENGGDGHPDALLLNNGKGKFKVQMQSDNLCGRGVSACDIDADGDQEVFVSNYRLDPNLLLSYRKGKFTDTAAGLNVKGKLEPDDGKYYGHTIGSCWGDVNNDGRIDLFSANLAHPRFVRQGFSNLSFLGIQNEEGVFEDTFNDSGIRFQETHSDPALIDIDNDGDLDLSITCVYEGVPSALFQNDGTGKFSPITFRAGAVAFHGWGQTWLDINQDGFLDVIYASGAGVRAFMNSGNDNHYLRVSLSARRQNTAGFGAIVTVTEADIDPETATPRTWVRQLFNTRGTSSQDEPLLHFGLGDYFGRCEVEVRWPGSKKVTNKRPKADTVYTVKK